MLLKKNYYSKRKKQEIINKLIEYKFPELATDQKSKSYDYITTMQLFSLTEEKINELNEKLKNKEEELAYVRSKSEIDMWNIELKEFLKAYKKWKEITQRPYDEEVVTTLNKIRKSTKIKRKKEK